jgi:hypothetical protein
MQCYKCRKELPDRATTCPSCGQAVYTTAFSPGASLGRRLDGCLPDAPSPRDYAAVPNVSSLPPRVDLRPGCSPVEDQGRVGSCTANAIVGAIEYKRRKDGRQDDLSRMFVYFNGRRMSGSEKEDCGLRIAHGMAAFLAHGAPPESAWPYDPERVATTPDDAAYAAAAANADVEYARLTGIDNIKGALARQQPVVFSISLPMRCYDEAATTGVVPVPSESELAAVLSLHGNHSMLLVGYDTDQNTFHVRNSWGTTWGDQGYCRLSIDTFQRAMAVHTAWILGSLEATGAFSVTRPPALVSTPVDGGVRDTASKVRSDIRSSVTKDMDDAMKSIRERVKPPRQG